jgi:hypothetical protein
VIAACWRAVLTGCDTNFGGCHLSSGLLQTPIQVSVKPTSSIPQPRTRGVRVAYGPWAALGLVTLFAAAACGPTILPEDARVPKDDGGAVNSGGSSGSGGARAGGSGGGAGQVGQGGTGGGNVISTIDAGVGNGGSGGSTGVPDAGQGGQSTGGQPGQGGGGAGAGGMGGGGGKIDAGGGGAGAGGADADAPDTAAAISCAGSTFALCEDFEGSATINSGLWKIVASKGTVTLDTTRAAGGSKNSVHVHVDPGSDTEVGLTETKTFPALKGGFFARAFIYIPSTDKDLNFTGDRHSRLFYAEGGAPYGEYALGIWNGGIIQNHYSPNDDSQDSKKLPPFDQWFCLEYELDASAGRVAAYLDGVEMTELRHTGWPATNLVNLTFGVTRFGSFPKSEDIWFDNIAVSNTRIGCTR